MRSAHRTALQESRNGLTEYRQTLDACPDTTGLTCTVDHLAIAPIKSFDMITLPAVQLTEQGLTSFCDRLVDRSAMLGVRTEGKPWHFTRFSQREAPYLAAVRASWDNARLTYTAPDMPPIHIQPRELYPQLGPVLKVRMSSDTDLQYVTMERGRITEWLRELVAKHDPATARALHLLLQPLGFERKAEDRHRCGTEALTTLTDGGQLLVTSRSTLDWMHERMTDVTDARRISMHAFRPNIVLSGLPPNVEDAIAAMRLEDAPVEILFGGLCVRCAVTTVDPETGMRRTDKQPLSWLARNRPARPPENTGVTFGVNCVWQYTQWRYDEPYTLRVDDQLTALREK